MLETSPKRAIASTNNNNTAYIVYYYIFVFIMARIDANTPRLYAYYEHSKHAIGIFKTDDEKKTSEKPQIVHSPLRGAMRRSTRFD